MPVTRTELGLPIKQYKVLLNQTGVAAPTKTDVSNDAGAFNWVYNLPGYYTCDFSSLNIAFTKVICRITTNSNHPTQSFHINYRSDKIAEIWTGSTITDSTSDNLLVNTCVEIDFYG